jgi:hypothetical protein
MSTNEPPADIEVFGLSFLLRPQFLGVEVGILPVLEVDGSDSDEVEENDDNEDSYVEGNDHDQVDDHDDESNDLEQM